jgi:hypothetical protein
MEWAIPIQSWEIPKIVIGSPNLSSTKLISPFSYVDGDANFNVMNILLPALAIKSYDNATGRLQISLQGMCTTKMNQFQDMIINTVTSNQHTWFPSEKPSDKDDIRYGFQPFVEHGCLHLYCPSSSTGVSNEINIYSNKLWSRGAVSSSLFVAGKSIRLAIKIQGLSYQLNPITKIWTGKFRLQHRILAILFNSS